MSAEEVEVYLVDVRKEMKDTKIHAKWPMQVGRSNGDFSGDCG